MTGRSWTLAGVLFSLFGVAAAAGVLHAREAVPASTERVLYVQAGETARRLFLSFDALASDVYWIRAIQHYGGDRKSALTAGRFELLGPLLDLTTTLDPHFNIAYRFGAIFLSLEPPNGPGRVDQAIALLEKGLRSNPARWQYAHDIGFIHYWYTGDYLQAARWFEKAAAMPGAPAWIGPLVGVTLAQGGDRQGARNLLRELRAADEPYIRAAADRALAQLDALDLIGVAQAAVERFRDQTGRYPTTWIEIVNVRLLPGLPVDPAGTPLAYRADTHHVTLSSESALFPTRGVQFAMTTGELVLLGAFGLAIGSFLNVCIGRLPAGESVVSPGSRCPSCRAAIRWFDNIPVVSYMVLGGKCRSCRAPISALYPFIEVATAVAFVLQGLAVGDDLPLLVTRLIFTSILIVLFGTDLETQRLPNVLTIPGIVLGFVFSTFLPPGPIDSLLGIALGGGLLLCLRWGWKAATGVDGMGLGDVKMLAMVGAFLGWRLVLVVLFLSSITGAVAGIALAVVGGRSMKHRIPFGTFLAGSALAASMVGEALAAWYLQFYQ